MKKDKKTGKFTVNPNSKRQQKLRAKAMGAATPTNEQPRRSAPGINAPSSVPASAFAGFAVDPPPAAATATVDDSTASADGFTGAAHGPSTADTVPSTAAPLADADGGSHVDDYFSPVDTSQASSIPDPEVMPPGDNPDDKSGTKRTKKKDKFFSAGVVEMLAGGWSTYVGFRHGWINNLDPAMPGVEEIKEAATINDAEKSMLTAALQEYMAETDFELTPGEELFLVATMIFAPRVVMLEGALYSGGKQYAASQKK